MRGIIAAAGIFVAVTLYSCIRAGAQEDRRMEEMKRRAAEKAAAEERIAAEKAVAEERIAAGKAVEKATEKERIAAEENRISTLLKNIRNLMEKAGWSAEYSMDVLDVSEGDRKTLQLLIR